METQIEAIAKDVYETAFRPCIVLDIAWEDYLQLSENQFVIDGIRNTAILIHKERKARYETLLNKAMRNLTGP